MTQRTLYQSLEHVASALAADPMVYTVDNPTEEIRSVYAHSLYVMFIDDAIRHFLFIDDL